MESNSLEVIYEDNHLLAVVKPAGLATMGLRDGRATLLTVAKEYVKQRYRKPGNVYLGVISRLDAPVTGIVLFARTSKAARRLTEQFRNRTVRKVYWALVEGVVSPTSASCEDWVIHDERHRRMHVADRSADGAKDARLGYRLLRRVEGSSLLEVRPETGRKHQIRLQLAHHGYPILGDLKYGSRKAFASGIALHAKSLTVSHPVTKEPLTLDGPLPNAWSLFGVTEW